MAEQDFIVVTYKGQRLLVAKPKTYWALIELVEDEFNIPRGHTLHANIDCPWGRYHEIGLHCSGYPTVSHGMEIRFEDKSPRIPRASASSTDKVMGESRSSFAARMNMHRDVSDNNSWGIESEASWNGPMPLGLTAQALHLGLPQTQKMTILGPGPNDSPPSSPSSFAIPNHGINRPAHAGPSTEHQQQRPAQPATTTSAPQPTGPVLGPGGHGLRRVRFLPRVRSRTLRRRRSNRLFFPASASGGVGPSNENDDDNNNSSSRSPPSSPGSVVRVAVPHNSHADSDDDYDDDSVRGGGDATSSGWEVGSESPDVPLPTGAACKQKKAVRPWAGMSSLF